MASKAEIASDRKAKVISQLYTSVSFYVSSPTLARQITQAIVQVLLKEKLL